MEVIANIESAAMASIPTLVGAFSPLILLLALSGCQPITGKTAGHPSSDLSISNAVQVRLMRDPLAGFPRIDIDTVRGVVKLSGMVETVAHRDRAERLVRQVDGVVEVDNGIQIQGRPLTDRYSHTAQLGDTQIDGSERYSGQVDHQAPSLRIYGGLIIQGDVVRVERGHYFVKEKDGKEVRLETDKATKMGHIKKGDHIVATVDEGNHALSIHSVP
jgi:hyperosmotically inducible periplasmic protein